jgi:hypothetical protein
MAWLLIFVAATFIGGCSSSDDDPAGPSGDTPPEFNGSGTTVTVPTGMANSGDPMANQAIGFINMANGMSAHGGWFTPPSGMRAAEGSWEESWSYEGMTVTLIVTETSTMYTWDVYIDGTIDDIVFDNHHFYHAWTTLDGSCVGLEFYAYDEFDGQLEWTWCTESDGTFTMSFIFGDYVDSFTIDILVNPDGSGEVDYAFNGTTVLFVSWDALGNGEWWTYDESGNPTGNDTWDAALN